MRLVLAATLIVLISAAAVKRNALYKNDVAIWADSVRKSPLKMRPHNNLGEGYLEFGKEDEAIKEWQTALSINPAYIPARANIAIQYMKKEKLKEAEAELLASLEKESPFTHIIRTQLGSVYAKKGLWEKAAQEYKTALVSHPYYAPARSALGHAYLNLEMLTEAEKELLAALELGLESADVRNNLGAIHMKRKDWEPAAAEFERALSLNPEYEPARKNLSYAYAEIGYSYGERKDPATALKFFKNALSIDPESLPAIYGYALSLEEMGNKKEAEKIWRNYLETAPLDDPFREEARKHLERKPRGGK
jgi:Tfp pilus assembly protein PilF